MLWFPRALSPREVGISAQALHLEPSCSRWQKAAGWGGSAQPLTEGGEQRCMPNCSTGQPEASCLSKARADVQALPKTTALSVLRLMWPDTSCSSQLGFICCITQGRCPQDSIRSCSHSAPGCPAALPVPPALQHWALQCNHPANLQCPKPWGKASSHHQEHNTCAHPSADPAGTAGSRDTTANHKERPAVSSAKAPSLRAAGLHWREGVLVSITLQRRPQPHKNLSNTPPTTAVYIYNTTNRDRSLKRHCGID